MVQEIVELTGPGFIAWVRTQLEHQFAGIIGVKAVGHDLPNQVCIKPSDLVKYADDYQCDCQAEAACNCGLYGDSARYTTYRGRVNSGSPGTTDHRFMNWDIETTPIKSGGVGFWSMSPNVVEIVREIHIDWGHAEGCSSIDPIESHTGSCPHRYDRYTDSMYRAFFELVTLADALRIEDLTQAERLSLLGDGQ